MSKLLIPALASIILVCIAPTARPDGFAVKSNLLYDAGLSANLGLEAGVAQRWSVEVSGNFNNWRIGDRQWRHWFVQPEARYWFCERFTGHFAGVHLIGGEFNFAPINDKRYQGRGAGAGIAYGYTWMLNRRWSVEAEIGAGWIYTRYDTFPCASCGTKLEHDRVYNYVGPTKAAINLIYVF